MITDVVVEGALMGTTSCGLIWQLLPLDAPDNSPGFFGYANGYVGLPQGHRYYGWDYEKIPVKNIRGGLTFARELHEYWVIGFDVCRIDQNRKNFGKDKCMAQLMDLVDQMKTNVLT